MIRIGQELHAIAERQPPPPVPADLFDRARRRSRRRRVTIGGLVVTAAASAAVLAGASGYDHRQPLHPGAAASTGLVNDLVGGGPDGPLGWIVLAVVLALLGYLWRGLRPAVLARRLAVTAVIGALVVLAAPPGTAFWGEPRGRAGLPDRLAEPSSWTWAADLRQSPPGPVAMVFSGPATHGNLEEGRIAMVSADGDRYRVLDAFSDPLESAVGPDSLSLSGGRFRALSPDGRYLSAGGTLFDLTTGRRATGVLADPPAAWSADGSRVVRRVYDQITGGPAGWEVWDLPSGRMLRSISVDATIPSGIVALSPSGNRLAVEQDDQILVYPVDGGSPRSWPRDGWRLGDVAWSPDGRLLAIVRWIGCVGCVDPAPQPRQIRLVDADTGTTVDGGEFAPLPADVEPVVQGWRTPDELVVQVGGAVKVFTRGTATPTHLLSLPAGVSWVEIATDRLHDPIHRAGPATYGPPNLFFWLLLAVTGGPVAAIWGGSWLVRRRHATATTTTPTADDDHQHDHGPAL